MSPSPLQSRWAKLGLGVAVAGLLLFGVEAGQYAAWGAPPPPNAVARVGGTELVVEGDHARLAHAVNADMDVWVPLAKRRPRVVTLGGSSVRHNGPPENNWPAPLQQLVPEVEVVNLASPGQTLGGLVQLVQQLEPLQPDLVIVYSGHNDVSQAVFSGQVVTTQSWTLAVWKVLALSWTAHRLSTPRQAAVPDPSRRAALAFTDDDSALRLHEDMAEAYEEELRRLLELSPAPVLLTTLLRNFDQAPQGLLTRDEGCIEVARGMPLTAPTEPARHAEELATACGETALGTWLGAHAAKEEGDQERAERLFAESLDRDPVPLRAPPYVDEVLRRVAAETGTPLVDLEADLGPLPPGEWFVDTLHPSAEGASRIAGRLAPKVRELLP